MFCFSHPAKAALLLLSSWLAAFALPLYAASTGQQLAASPPITWLGQPRQLLALPQATTDATVMLLRDQPEDYATAKKYVVHRDGQPVPTLPYFRTSSFLNFALRVGQPQDTVVLQGFSEPNLCTKNLIFGNLTPSDGASVRLSHCGLVPDAVRTVSGARPQHEVTDSGKG